ncbi:MAG: hypothetical protein AAGA10_24265 [Bacteroidota bacterium]
MKRFKITKTLLFLGIAISLNSFNFPSENLEYPSLITRNTKTNSLGEQVVQTEILIDKAATREDLIHTCQFLAKENVALTFESLNIRKSFLGLFGKSRIINAKGKIKLPNDSMEEFEVGGTFGFRFIKITFSENTNTRDYYINMVEVID